MFHAIPPPPDEVGALQGLGQAAGDGNDEHETEWDVKVPVATAVVLSLVRENGGPSDDDACLGPGTGPRSDEPPLGWARQRLLFQVLTEPPSRTGRVVASRETDPN